MPYMDPMGMVYLQKKTPDVTWLNVRLELSVNPKVLG